MGCLPAAINLVYPLPDVRGYDAADPVRIVQLLASIRNSNAAVFPYAQTQWFYPQKEMPMLDLLNLRYMIYPGSPPPNFPAAWVGDGYFVLLRPSATSRVFVPREVQVIEDSAQRLARMSDLAWNPRDLLILESTLAPLSSNIQGEAKIVEDGPSQVRVEANMQTKGFVLLADQWDSGWRAYIEGRSLPILRADHAFRAVEVPAGQSTIEFRYEPASFTWGCYGAGLGSLLLVAGSVLLRRRHQ